MNTIKAYFIAAHLLLHWLLLASSLCIPHKQVAYLSETHHTRLIILTSFLLAMFHYSTRSSQLL